MSLDWRCLATTENSKLCLQVVEISRRQMDALCGNVLEVEDGRGHPVLALSSQSYHAFTEDQRRQVKTNGYTM